MQEHIRQKLENVEVARLGKVQAEERHEVNAAALKEELQQVADDVDEQQAAREGWYLLEHCNIYSKFFLSFSMSARSLSTASASGIFISTHSLPR